MRSFVKQIKFRNLNAALDRLMSGKTTPAQWYGEQVGDRDWRQGELENLANQLKLDIMEVMKIKTDNEDPS